MNRLFCFGFGYSAQALARRLDRTYWTIAGTATSDAGVTRLTSNGYDGVLFDGDSPGRGVRKVLTGATHVLVSIPPGEQGGDPALRHHGAEIARSPAVGWIGYLSTVGVYGDRGGAWIDEDAAPQPMAERSIKRLAAEQDWLAHSEQTGKRVQIFRLAGIYGPGRSAIDGLRAGTTRRIVKPGQVMNRIHVDDIAAVLEAALAGDGRHSVYNVADDEPAPPQDVVTYAAKLLDMAPPPETAFESAALSDMAASFYAENKRVANTRIKRDLGVRLAYPTYRDGLTAIARRYGLIQA